MYQQHICTTIKFMSTKAYLVLFYNFKLYLYLHRKRGNTLTQNNNVIKMRQREGWQLRRRVFHPWYLVSVEDFPSSLTAVMQEWNTKHKQVESHCKAWYHFYWAAKKWTSEIFLNVPETSKYLQILKLDGHLFFLSTLMVKK